MEVHHHETKTVPPGFYPGGHWSDHLALRQRRPAVRPAPVPAQSDRLLQAVRPGHSLRLYPRHPPLACGRHRSRPLQQAEYHGSAGLFHRRPHHRRFPAPGVCQPGGAAGRRLDTLLRYRRRIPAGCAGQRTGSGGAGAADAGQFCHQYDCIPRRSRGTGPGRYPVQRIWTENRVGDVRGLLYHLRNHGAVYPHSLRETARRPSWCGRR